MKRTIILSFLPIIIAMAGLLIFSCNKSTSNAICEQCKPKDPIRKQISFKLGEQIPEEFLLNYYKSKYKTGDLFELGKIMISDAFYDKLIPYFLQISNINSQPYAIVLYFETFLSETKVIDINKITAFSWYYLIKDGKQLHHRLFILKENNFIENLEFNIDVSFVTVNQSSFQLNVVIPKIINKPQDSKSYITIFKESQSFKKFKFGRSDFEHLFKKYESTSSLLKDSEPYCPMPCPGDGDLCIETNNYRCYDYDWDPCAAMDQQQALLNEGAMSSDSIYQAYDSTTLYSFKDSVLHPNTFGQKYIDYYYELSTKLREKAIPLSLIISTARTSIKCRGIFQLLSDSADYPDSVFLSTEQRDELLDLIDNYKTLFSDSLTLGKLNDIKCDINTYTGYTVQNFLHDIN